VTHTSSASAESDARAARLPGGARDPHQPHELGTQRDEQPTWLAPLLCALALAATAAALWPVLGGELVYDDLLLVARNPALASVSALLESFGAAHWDNSQSSGADADLPVVGYWRPATMLVLFLGRVLGDGAPWGHHALSLAIHLGAVALVFALVRRLTHSVWIGAGAALLFGLHPVQVESVAWISAVNDPLAGALTLAALLSYLRWRDDGSRGAPWAAGAWLLAGLLAKESALAFAPLALALDCGRTLRSGARRFERLGAALAPALAAFGVYYVLRVAVFGELAAGFDRITSHLYSPPLRWLTLRLELLGGALQLLVFPAELNLFREVRPEVPLSDPTLLRALAALAAWAGATYWAWRKRSGAVLSALLILPAGILPAVLRFESIGRFPLSERFLYLSALGVALLAATLLARLPRAAALGGALLLAGAAGTHSFARTAVWANEETLFRDGVARSPRCMYVQWGLGRVLLQRFQDSLDVRQLLEAHDAFDRAQQLAIEKPPDPRVLITPFDELQSSLGMGWYYLYCALHLPQECTLDEPELIFRELAKRAPRSADVLCGHGVSLRYLGRYDEASEVFARAVSESPQHFEAWFNRGKLEIERARWLDAVSAFERCTQIAPTNVEAWVSLAMCAMEADLAERARDALKRAVALAPDDAGVLKQLGVLAAREQRYDDALEAFERALRVRGSDGPAHLMRGKTLLFLGRPKEALEAFLDATRWLQEPALDPLRPQQTFDAFYNAGVLASELSTPQKAIELLEEARRRDPDGSRREALTSAIDALRAHSEAKPPADAQTPAGG
jgi:tetratricopeptide (TPR) repeat protein